MSDGVIDKAIAVYVHRPTDDALCAIYSALLAGSVIVPVSESPRELQSDCYDIPVICIRTQWGTRAIPVFTMVEHILRWKPEGCHYVTLAGRQLLLMAVDMLTIDEVVINPSGGPHGQIPRAAFSEILSRELTGRRSD
ncbi:MAG: SseB family protein [Phycisphaerales bacterium]